MRFALLLALAGALLAGCNNKEVSGCTKDEQCPSGNVCLEGKCEKLCSTDRDCAAGRFCDGEICVVGSRGGEPQIADITGGGSEACVFDTGRNCIGTHFVVTGANLGGSEFLLGSTDPSGPQYVMTVPAGGRLQDDIVDLIPEGGVDLVPGDYMLVVSNAAGEDQAGVTLLKGEPGDGSDLTGDAIVERINASTSKIDADNIVGGGGAMTGTEIVTAINDSSTAGIISSERVAGGGGGGGATLYFFDDSTTATTSGHSGNRMVVRITASTSGVASLEVNQTRLEELCGDPDGCQISLGTIGWRYNGQALWKITAPFVNTSCRFFLSEGTGASGGDSWSVSSSCAQPYMVCNGYNSPCTDHRLYIPHYSGAFGSDGYAGAGDPPDDTLNVIQNRACYFAESPPNTGLGCACDTDSSCTGSCDCDPNCACACDTDASCTPGCNCDAECIYTRLEDDTGKGFTLFASHPEWAGPYWVGDAFWPSSDPDRACVLVVED